MDIASVMAVVDGSTQSRAALKAGVRLGQIFGAHTHLLQIEAPPLLVVPPMHSNASQTVASIMADLKSDNEERRNRFRHFLNEDISAKGIPLFSPETCASRNRGDFSVCAETVAGHESREIARRGRMFDIVVVVLPDASDGGTDNASLEATLFETGRPALLVPSDHEGSFGTRITVGWDGSSEAAKSIHNAMPFIRRAESVQVVHVIDDKNGEIDPTDVTKYFALHGIEACPKRIEKPDTGVANCVLETAYAHRSDLLVIGAYDESLWDGNGYGATAHELIDHGKLPILIAH